MNVTLLEQAKHSIMADPNFNACSWEHCIAQHVCRVSKGLTPDTYGADEYYDVLSHSSCIQDHHVYSLAQILLDFTEEQRFALFFPANWPRQFTCNGDAFEANPSIWRDRENAIRRIDSFIATNGTDQESNQEQETAIEAIEERELVGV